MSDEISLEPLHRECRAFLLQKRNYARLERALKTTKAQWGDTEVWRAAKDALKAGRHDGPCDNERDPDNDACTIHLQHFEERMQRLERALR